MQALVSPCLSEVRNRGTDFREIQDLRVLRKVVDTFQLWTQSDTSHEGARTHVCVCVCVCVRAFFVRIDAQG